MTKNQSSEGRFLTMVKVGPKGQIVIPAEAREMFGIAPGDSLLLLADREQGIALPPPEQTEQIIEAISQRLARGSDGS